MQQAIIIYPGSVISNFCRRRYPISMLAARLMKLAEDYKYSSANFYQNGFDEFNMITHYTGN